jgi:hypothetical protein
VAVEEVLGEGWSGGGGVESGCLRWFDAAYSGERRFLWVGMYSLYT